MVCSRFTTLVSSGRRCSFPYFFTFTFGVRPCRVFGSETARDSVQDIARSHVLR